MSLNYRKADELLQGRCRKSRKLANNTYLERDGEKIHVMYTHKNFKSKKELKAAVDAFNAGTGPKVTYFQPGPFGGNEPKDGTFCIVGPHYPQPHRFYATCAAKDGAIIKVK